MKTQFDVSGMTCSACSAHVEKAVGKLDGVREVQVALLSNSMSVTYDEQALDGAAIVAAVEKAGYGATVRGEKAAPAAPSQKDELHGMQQRLIWSFVFLVPLFYISMGHMMGMPLPGWLHGKVSFALTQLLLSLPILYLNRKYFQVGFTTLFRGSPNMDSLIAIGSTAALLYGVFAIYRIGWGLEHGQADVVARYSMDLYFESAGMILTLITLGKYLETRSKGRTSEAIARLLDLAPETATVERDGIEREIPSEQVQVGDLVIVRPGGRVPVDGEVVEGASAVDESALTGESIPVEKLPGDSLAAATINRTGWLKFRATKVGADTTLAQIIRLVEEAANSKAPIAKLADRVSGIFVPVVIGIALLSAIVWLILGQSIEFALSIGIAVLVISCPCALGLATPVAIMVGTGKGAEHGILIKSAEALETAHKIDTVVLDKTGTITEGKPSVTDLIPADGVSASELLAVAVALERPSEHPLAEAVVAYAKQTGQDAPAADGFESIPGQGVRANVDGKTCAAGNPRLLETEGVHTHPLIQKGEQLSEEGKTPLYFTADGKLLGVIAVADTIKPTSREAVAQLTALGIDVVMLTGDNRRTAAAIQRQVGIGRVVAEVLPQDKEREVARLREAGKKVAMIGDGINDAPALMRADVGIAIGAGADVAIESADIVLMKSDLLDAVTAIGLSRAVIRNIKQNLFWAFFYNTIGIPLAAGIFIPLLGWQLNPMFAAAAMSLSSVCVVSNALRLKLFAPKHRNLQIATAAVQVAETKEETTMTKTMEIEGMSCGHCSARVEQALGALDGVDATVDLAAKTATIKVEGNVSDDLLRATVTEAGYQVVSLK